MADRNRNFGRPIIGVNFRFGIPDSVPVFVSAVAAVHNCHVFARTERIDPEEEPTTPVVVSIQQDEDVVVIPQHRIAAHLISDNFRRFRFRAEEPEIEVFRIVKDAHLCRFCQRRAFIGFKLRQLPNRHRVLPILFREFPINFNALISAICGYLAFRRADGANPNTKEHQKREVSTKVIHRMPNLCNLW